VNDDQTDIYYVILTARGRYRHDCDGWEMRSPTWATLYDSPEDAARYARLHPGDTIEPIVFTRRYYMQRDP
jgi:hypothetical protein